MRRRIWSLVLVFSMILSCIVFNVSAASVPEITSHEDGESYDADDFCIEWKVVEGAKRYRLAVKSLDDGSYAADIWWDDRLIQDKYYVDEDDLKPGHEYKIWIGACRNNHDDVIGQYSIVVKVNDADTTYPMINPIKSSEGSSFEEGTSVTFSTRASDNALEKVYMYIDGDKVKSTSSDVIEYTTDELSVGEHTVEVIAEDESGNENETSIEVTVTKKEIKIETVKLASPDVEAENEVVEVGEGIELSWDKVKNADYYTVHIWSKDEYIDDITALNYDVDGFDEPGVYSISVYARSYDNDVYLQSEPGGINITVEEAEEEEVSYGSFSPTPQQEQKSEPSSTPVYEIKSKDTQSPEITQFKCDTLGTVNRDEVESLTFRATAEDNIGVKSISLMYEGVCVKTEYDSSFEGDVMTSALSLGENEFYVVAEDKEGNEAYSYSIYINIEEDEEEVYHEAYTESFSTGSFSSTPQQSYGYTQTDGSWHKPGDIINEVLNTDILADIDGYPIRSFNIDGYTAVVAEDLRDYGFNVIYDNSTRTLKIYEGNKNIVSQYSHVVNTAPVGSKAMDVYYTDIKTYVNDKQVNGYNVGGYTIVFIEDLRPFGNPYWNEWARTISLNRR